ncbi:hypothetical protein LCGC14_1505560 [marine sediment metagenome]|uniref:Uncharacterized protein n=1 Tax=marine sediment metagenome TaxID=412755 RepID=A0A0F9JNL1_9ZZZZ
MEYGMNKDKIIDAMFEAMAKGELSYQLVRLPFLGNGLFLDFRNGLIAGEVKGLKNGNS